jgi:hypothetical protein
MTAVRSSFYVALTYFLGVHSSLEGSLSVEYIPLDGDALYEFSWAGSPAAAHPEDVAALRPSDDEQLLPNQLLPAGYTEEVVSMVTAQHEMYKCVLPHSRTNEDGEDDLIDSKYLTPESLLQPLQLQCLKLNQGYWSYELCHGQSLRQFHEENTGKVYRILVSRYYCACAYITVVLNLDSVDSDVCFRHVASRHADGFSQAKFVCTDLATAWVS